MSSQPSGSGTINGEPILDHEEHPEWAKSKTGKRIAELNEVEESIARVLHIAGSVLASLHPDPLSSFTSQVLEFDDDEEDEDEDTEKTALPGKGTENEQKGEQFGRYIEAYYATLNDIQLSLRHSVRHLRQSHFTPAPLLSPSFHSLSTPGGGNVGVGGIALGDLSHPNFNPNTSSEETSTSMKNEKIVRRDTPKIGGAEKDVRLGVNALRVESEAWRGLRDALSSEEGGDKDNEEKMEE